MQKSGLQKREVQKQEVQKKEPRDGWMQQLRCSGACAPDSPRRRFSLCARALPQVPRAILCAIVGVGVTGYMLLLSLTFAKVDPASLFDPGNETGGANVVLQIVIDVRPHEASRKAPVPRCLVQRPFVAQTIAVMTRDHVVAQVFKSRYGSVDGGVALYSFFMASFGFCLNQILANNARCAEAWPSQNTVCRTALRPLSPYPHNRNLLRAQTDTQTLSTHMGSAERQ